MTTLNLSIAVLLVRLLAGILFFAQAYEKIFKVKLKNVVEVFGVQFQEQIISKPVMTASIYISSFVELTCGGLLILGLFRSVALYLLSADLLLVAIAFSLIKPMWDMQFYFPRIVFIVLLLLLPPQWDVWCLDSVLIK